MTVLSLSLMGSIMILVICGLRAAVRGRLPRRTFVVLWLLAAIRLVLPWQITSPVSVYRLFPVPSPVSAVSADIAGIRIIPPAGSQEMVVQDPAAEYTPIPADPGGDPWAVIWWTGALLCAGAVTVIYVRWTRRFAESLPADAPVIETFMQRHALGRRYQVRISSHAANPLTYGVLRPVILLPASIDLRDAKQLEYILTHEYMHIRHFDALLKIVFAAACCMHWFNPLVWIMYILASRDMELACDESVVKRCGGCAEYARMLIRLEAQKAGYAIPGMNCSAGAVRERITSIMKLKKKSAAAIILAGALIAGVGTAFATSAPKAGPEGGLWSEVTEQDALVMEVVAEEASYADSADRIEWWTTEAYEAWLEKEKEDLQSILGSKGWTPSEGEFEWTQERIDETIAGYEQILRDIRGGMRVSKSVNGDDSITIMQRAAAHESTGTSADYIDPQLMREYAAFGLTLEADGPVYKGEKVRYFEDSVEVGPGMTASRATYYSDNGTAFLRTVREPQPNPDGLQILLGSSSALNGYRRTKHPLFWRICSWGTSPLRQRKKLQPRISLRIRQPALSMRKFRMVF